MDFSSKSELLKDESDLEESMSNLDCPGSESNTEQEDEESVLMKNYGGFTT